MRRIGTRGKGGAALITAIVFVFFLTLFGLAFYRLGETDIDLFGYEKNLSKALYASEAGIDKVRWMIRESHQITVVNANPFSNNYVEADALSIANPTDGDFFPGEQDNPYFKVFLIQAEGSKVRVRVLGSVDVEVGGEAQRETTEDGFTVDPLDVNRKFEAYIGLPGTLGEKIGGKGISAAAGAFYAGGVEVSLSSESRQFITPDGDQIKDRNGNDRFLYFGSGPPSGIWDRWGFIFSDPAPTVFAGEISEVELPLGIFDADGNYIDDDGNNIPDYFQDLDPEYTGDPNFTRSNDPTAGAEGRSVIYFDGDITIDRVDFGYLNDQGEIKDSDWEKTDLTFIANGKITLNRVDCGNVGRLVLVAKDIELVGDYNTKVNGIALAFNDITLNGSGCTNGILTRPPPDDNRPVNYTAYFLGSMVAGNHIVLQNDGWTVIYDENVINGNMYSTTLSKPTLTYERVEAEDFNTTNNWDLNGGEFLRTQEDYIQEDIDNARADYSDGGADGVPELMKMYQQPGWHPGPLSVPPDHDHDFGVTDGVYCDFTDVGNVFEDSDINIGPQDWDNYTTIRFYMALDNWQKIAGSKTTYRKSLLQVRLEDTGGNRVTFNVPYQNNDWVGAPGKAHWEPVRINPHDFDPLDPFDSRSVQSIEFYWKKIEVSWYIDGETESIAFINDDGTGYGNDGYYQYIKSDGSEYPVWFQPPDANGRRQLYYTDLVLGDQPIQWNWDPSTSTLENIYFEDTLDPLKSALVSVFKIDRLELPGKPATNDYLEYGLPHSLRLEVTNWQEL